MKGAPRSKQFGDVYFSVTDGLAESAYVYLQGNNLPAAWEGKDRFVIAETGFGTGLNILAAWKLFEDTAPPGQKLDFISVEKFPLTAEEIHHALSTTVILTPAKAGRKNPSEILRDAQDDRKNAGLDYYLHKLLAKYPLRIPGFHRINLNENVTLTLIFDDVNDALPQITAEVDCWFLDGFMPRNNPEMWTDTVFENMRRLSKPGTSFATFTAAGFVKRALRGQGFTVQKIKGFGTKWSMLTGFMP